MKYKNLRSKPAPNAQPFKSTVYDRLSPSVRRAVNKLREKGNK